ncbi:MAG: DUF4041 domain-containing protein [Phascolarctobacterium sp.]|nr:DUF4041 domain-containing protein [Phascolarctobacterium sp.]
MLKSLKNMFGNNKEIENLNQVISEKDNKITELQTNLNKLIEENNNLKQLIPNDSKQIIQLREQLDAMEKLAYVKKTNIASLNSNIENLKSIILDYESQKKEISKEIVELRDEVLVESFALYRPIYNFTNSDIYKDKLDDIRNKQKELIKQDKAAFCTTNWTVNNSQKEGSKMVDNIKKLLLRAFNSECEFVTSKVKYNNYDSCLNRINKASEQIEKLGAVMNIQISPEYLRLKILELRLALEYQKVKQQEKEDQKELRAQAREEARVQKELEAERAKIEKERQHYNKALLDIKKQLTKTTDETQKIALETKLSELESHIKEVDENLSNIDYRVANQRAGYVYIISNIGSFGENVYKIGMTRRLDPVERVDELGDASVPFNFDIHAMIFTDDAPKLENALHQAFDHKKLNRVNKRREFFNVTLEEIENVVKQNFDGSVEFIKVAEAEQYRESLRIAQNIN